MAKPKYWTREELIVALNLYCKIPFKNSSASHPLVIKYAKLIGRSPAAMNLKRKHCKAKGESAFFP